MQLMEEQQKPSGNETYSLKKRDELLRGNSITNLAAISQIHQKPTHRNLALATIKDKKKHLTSSTMKWHASKNRH